MPIDSININLGGPVRAESFEEDPSDNTEGRYTLQILLDLREAPLAQEPLILPEIPGITIAEEGLDDDLRDYDPRAGG